MTARAKFLYLLAAIEKDCNCPLLHHQSVLLYEADVVEFETPSELARLARPHTTREVYAILRE
jgi:hypothetical protein